MRVARTSRARAGCVTTCLVRLMLVMLLIGLAGLVAFTYVLVRTDPATQELVDDLAPDVTPERTANGPVIVLPAADESAPGLLAFTTQQDPPAYSLTYLDRDTGDVVWESDVLADASPRYAPVLGPDAVYVVGGDTRLAALALADGDRRWDVELPAPLSAGCAGCILALPDAVAALGEDATLRVYDAESGDLRWEAPLDTTPREVLAVGNHPAVIDTLPETGDAALLIFDAADGSLRQQIEPRCPPGDAGDRLAPGSPALIDPASGDVFFLFGFDEQGCAQRWDAATDTIVWSSAIRLDAGGWPRTWTTATPLLTGDAIYFAGAEGGSIVAIATADGSARVLLESDAYVLEPWSVSGETLLVHAERLAGTEDDELWGIELKDGARRWRYPITHDNSSWTAHLAADGFLVIQLLPEPDRLQIDILDPLSGAALRHRTLEVGGGVWSGTTWTEDAAWLTIRALYTVDLHTGLPAQVWPPPDLGEDDTGADTDAGPDATPAETAAHSN